MKYLSVRRLNCIYGEWMYPDSKTGPERLTFAEMAAKYISLNEGQKVTPDDFATLRFRFEYDNPRQSGMHGVPGTVHLSWRLRR